MGGDYYRGRDFVSDSTTSGFHQHNQQCREVPQTTIRVRLEKNVEIFIDTKTYLN